MPKNLKICPYPFSRHSLGNPKFIPCCTSWFKSDYFKLDHSGNPWDSPAANELRQSILDGNFKYCNRDICHMPLTDITHVDEVDDGESYIGPDVIQKIKNDEPLDKIPMTSIEIAIDNRCNLACKSCRKELITTPHKDAESNIFGLHILLRKYLPELRRISFAGYTEFFFTRWSRDLVKNLNKNNAPKLRGVSLLTNATLLDKKMYESMGEGFKNIKTINVSLDAGNGDTYKVLRGGNWERLVKNLEFISELRKNNEINSFIINMTIQINNLDSVDEFVALGERLGVDGIFISQLLNWSQVMALNFVEHAVHLPNHLDHHKYIEKKNLYENHPLVMWRIS